MRLADTSFVADCDKDFETLSVIEPLGDAEDEVDRVHSFEKENEGEGVRLALFIFPRKLVNVA